MENIPTRRQGPLPAAVIFGYVTTQHERFKTAKKNTKKQTAEKREIADHSQYGIAVNLASSTGANAKYGLNAQRANNLT